MSIAMSFENAVNRIDLEHVIEIYKEEAVHLPEGYLNTLIFQRMRDGTDDELVKRFFAKPFAEVRTWLPQMLGLYISRFPDHPYTYVVADNLSDEYGKYLSNDEIVSSHAQLYRRVLDALGVKVAEATMCTPAQLTSEAAQNFYYWFKEKTIKEPPGYMIGHFLAYEITDVLDFPKYLTAVKRIWPDNETIQEFFTEHIEAEHDMKFSQDLQPFFAENQEAMVAAMGSLLEKWTLFYHEAAEEVQV